MEVVVVPWYFLELFQENYKEIVKHMDLDKGYRSKNKDIN